MHTSIFCKLLDNTVDEETSTGASYDINDHVVSEKYFTG